MSTIEREATGGLGGAPGEPVGGAGAERTATRLPNEGAPARRAADASAHTAGYAPAYAPPEPAPLRVLVVDDDEVDRLIVRRGLARGGATVAVDEAATTYEALERVASTTYDCVFLDYNIPGGDGLTLLRGIKRTGLDLPVVMLTGQGDEQVAVELMKAGAADYLPKAALTPERLTQSLRYAVDLARAALATRRAEEEREASAARTVRLQQVTARMAVALATPEVAELFVTEVREATGAAMAWVATLAPGGNALHTHASTMRGTDLLATAEGRARFGVLPLDAPLPAMAVLRDGEPRWYEARATLLAGYPALGDALQPFDLEAMAVLPLDAGAEPFGVVALGFSAPRPFAAEERAFVHALARQCGQALERARLYEAEQRSRAAAERLAARLAGAAQAITRQETLDGVLRELTVQARGIIGAHQAVTSLTVADDWSQTINTVSLSERYAAWREYATQPDGSGIYRLVAQANAPMRLTQAELEAHPAWHGFGHARAEHPPMRGWLAAPLVARDGTNLGLLQLSDREDGDFTAADESILVQLAEMGAAAIENARLRERADAARQVAEEANRAKSEFLARMSHDLRTPLNAIGGYAQLVELGVHGPVTDAQRDALARVRRAQEHLLTLINDILSFAKLEAGQVRVVVGAVPVAALVHELAALVQPEADARGLALAVDAGGDNVVAHADRERLLQVLLNLTSNALKFTERGGLRLEAAAAGAWVELRVHDSGIGIPTDRLTAIFDPFVQARGSAAEVRGGVGLGLAISRELLRLMGGELTVTSAEGRGSTFIVRIPRVSDAEPSALVEAPAGTPRG